MAQFSVLTGPYVHTLNRIVGKVNECLHVCTESVNSVLCETTAGLGNWKVFLYDLLSNLRNSFLGFLFFCSFAKKPWTRDRGLGWTVGMSCVLSDLPGWGFKSHFRGSLRTGLKTSLNIKLLSQQLGMKVSALTSSRSGFWFQLWIWTCSGFWREYSTAGSKT